MAQPQPTKLTIVPDDWYLRYAGRTRDGLQFVVLNPLIPAAPGRARRDFVALYVFGGGGELVRHEIVEVAGNWSEIERQTQLALTSVGAYEPAKITVNPFLVSFADTAFGLVARDAGDEWRVEVMPGNPISFTEPFLGEYDT